MPFFAYKGRDGRGQLVQGVLEGADSSAVAGQLFNSGVTPLEIESSAVRESGPGLLAPLKRQKITHTEVLLFSRHMYTLLKAGVPIMGALKGLAEATQNPSFSNLVREIRENLEGGRELSATLVQHPAVFGPFYVAMVRVGEFTGTLDEVFLRLFHHMEFEKFISDQVRAAVRYPAFVIATMAIALVIINLFVIPVFAKVYKGFKTELPAITKGMIGFSEFVVGYWPVMLVALVVLLLGVRAYVKTPRGRLVWDEFKLKLPVAGPIVLKATLARFARSFSLALRSGVPAVQALSVTAQTVDNAHVARRIDRMREGVERGESVLRTATAAGVFTPIVLQMLAVGEETGALDDLLAEVADMYKREVEYDLKNLASQIEPILVIALGVIVLILALGVFLPIWDLGNVALGKRG
ncbi:MAG: type II secretion system F family protein [Betaproteobacteria bacterium]|nr:type II secretion system F family protein [Betaproteobacteria bacterium]MDH3436799.1 type II secretion system F family protein [Betaproteobacteria bacterium]